MLELPGVLWWC